MLGRTAFLVAVLIATSASAQAYKPPRTSFGVPDLQGVCNNDSMTKLQRPKGFAGLVATPAEAAAYEAGKREKYAKGVAPTNPDEPAPDAGKVEDESPQWSRKPLALARIRGEIRSSWIVDPADGKLPYTEASKAAAEKALKDEEVYDDPEGRPFDERCLLGGGGGVAAPIMNPDLMKIVQTRDHVVLLGEQNHEARIIPLGDRRHVPPAIRPWMGDSVGWWEGDTLVVESTNLNPSDRWRWNAGEWILLSPGTRIVERFRRTGRDEIVYSYVVTDPAVYTQPWRGEMPFHATTAPILEFACHEGNYSLSNILAGARQQKQAAGATAP